MVIQVPVADLLTGNAPERFSAFWIDVPLIRDTKPKIPVVVITGLKLILTNEFNKIGVVCEEFIIVSRVVV